MQVAFETWGTTHHPTTDGRQLEISEGELFGELTLSFEFRDPEKSLPTDALACELQIADREGHVWSTTARFTTKVFITHMFDFAASDHMPLFRPKNADDDFQQAFQGNTLLRKARFSSDDRFYRTLAIDKELVTTKFKYTQIKFDVAAVKGTHPSLTKLAVKVHKDSFRDEEDSKSLGELGFYVSCQHLLRNNTGIFDPRGQRWRDGPLPLPLVFAGAGKQTTRQEIVRAVEAAPSAEAGRSASRLKKPRGK